MQEELQFIKARIQEIKSALFHSEGYPFTRFCTCIIRCLDVDERGNIWFFVNDDTYCSPDDLRKFPATLSFYRKGKPFFIRISGLAEVMNSEVVVENFVGQPDNYELMLEKMKLIKVKIEQADYQEWDTVSYIPWWQKAYHYVHQWWAKPAPVKQPHYSFT